MIRLFRDTFVTTQDGNGVQYRVPREVLQEIQARTSLVEVIGRYVSLQKRGRSYVGLCPFHSEKSPSFHVDESRRMFYCFGCQSGGDVFKFLTLIENEGFMDVVRDLASRCGLALPERELTREEKQRMDERDSIQGLYEVAASYYERMLMSPQGAKARAYLAKRALPPEIVQSFRIGYAPEGWGNLTDYLRQQRYSLPLAEKAGLIAPRTQDRHSDAGHRAADGHYDRFRDRVMFPIRNISGKVIAFGGRILDQGEPKYYNSPEHPLFNKSAALYGLDTARRAIAQEDCVLVVEGYFDALALYAAGIHNVVATCGTSLTKGHLSLLKRYTRRVILVYDGDKAGQNASERSLPLFLDEGLWPSFIGLPQGKDPDEVVKEEGEAAFRERIRTAVPLLDYVIGRRARVSGSDAQAREESLAELAPLLLRVSPEKLDFYVSIMARQFGMMDLVVHEYLARAREDARPSHDLRAPSLRPPTARPAMTLPAEEAFLVQWILQRPEEILPACQEADIVHFFTHDALKQVVEYALSLYTAGQPVEANHLVEHCPHPGLQTRMAELTLKEFMVQDNERERAKEQCLLGIKERFFQGVANRLKGEIKHAESSAGNPALLPQLLTQFQAVDREVKALKKRIGGKLGT